MLKYISKFTRYAPIAQLDRVSGYEPEGRGFESLLACQKLMMVGLAQLAEHRIVVPGVVGSSPISHPIYKIIEAGVAGLGS